MRRLALSLLVAVPVAGLAQEGAPGGAPAGLTATFSLGGGGELGLDEGEGDAGILELEAALGFELGSSGLRPELAAVFGVSPDTHVALRPGVRLTLPSYPIQLRVAFDAANARDRDFEWRWFLVGAAAELRFTSLLGLFAEVDTGFKLSSGGGVPLLVRAGASFRF